MNFMNILKSQHNSFQGILCEKEEEKWRKKNFLSSQNKVV